MFGLLVFIVREIKGFDGYKLLLLLLIYTLFFEVDFYILAGYCLAVLLSSGLLSLWLLCEAFDTFEVNLNADYDLSSIS